MQFTLSNRNVDWLFIFDWHLFKLPVFLLRLLLSVVTQTSSYQLLSKLFTHLAFRRLLFQIFFVFSGCWLDLPNQALRNHVAIILVEFIVHCFHVALKVKILQIVLLLRHAILLLWRLFLLWNRRKSDWWNVLRLFLREAFGTHRSRPRQDLPKVYTFYRLVSTHDFIFAEAVELLCFILRSLETWHIAFRLLSIKWVHAEILGRTFCLVHLRRQLQKLFLRAQNSNLPVLRATLLRWFLLI